MCFRGRRVVRVVVAAIALSAIVPMPVRASQSQPEPPAAASPDAAEIARALAAVRADPNLATERTIPTLHWRDTSRANRSPTPAWLTWTTGLFKWLDQSARVLLWGTAATLVGLLAVFIVRRVRKFNLARDAENVFVAPTHVRDLDIRPESLPGDIGVAARRLWDQGDHRAALALLYRGLLSRLAHVHSVPIRDSSTEGDCLTLAANHVAVGTREYTSRLVTAWQRFVYGGQQAPAATVHALCDEFARYLDRTEPIAPTTDGGAA